MLGAAARSGRVVAARGPALRQVQARLFWFKSSTTDFARRRAQRVNFANPGERLPYVADGTLFALPPMAKPFKPSDARLGWYAIRARLFWAVFLLSGFSYAAYLHVNDRGQGRLRLVRTAPALAEWLQQAGILQRYPASVRGEHAALRRPLHVPASPPQRNVDRTALFRRVWLRYAGSRTTMPEEEAIQLAADLSFAPEAAQHAAALLTDLRQRAAAKGAAAFTDVDLPMFVHLLHAATGDTGDELLYLAALERLGVPALSVDAEAELTALYNFVVASNGGSNLFTVPYLAALTDELGFTGSEERARYFLTETQAVVSGAVALSPGDWVIADATAADRIRRRREVKLPTLPPAAQPGEGSEGTALLIRSSVRVPVTAGEWVDYMGDVMRASSDEDIKAACEVFVYLQSARPSG